MSSRRIRVLLQSISLVGVLGLVLSGCGGKDSGSVFDSAPSSTSTAADGTQNPSGTVAPSTTEPAEEDLFEFIANYEFDETPAEPTSSLGSANLRAAEAIAADLTAGGVDLTGVELWVFGVNGTEERLLVVEANRGPEKVLEDPTGSDLLEVLVDAASFQDAGITRFVLNYYDTDEQGAFVLTTTLAMEALLGGAGDAGADASELAAFAALEIFRIEAAPTTQTTTTATIAATPTPLPTANPVILADTFDGSTAVVPLFNPGVMSSVVTAEEQLQITVFTTGVIAAMYPDPLPSRVEISFDFSPLPNGSTASYGALVLSEEPADLSLENYVAVWANQSDGLLTVIPWNAPAGGWGPATVAQIPASVGYTAGGWYRMRLVVLDGAVAVYLDDVFIAEWTGATPVTVGHWGPVVIGATSGDSMLVDNVLVEEAE